MFKLRAESQAQSATTFEIQKQTVLDGSRFDEAFPGVNFSSVAAHDMNGIDAVGDENEFRNDDVPGKGSKHEQKVCEEFDGKKDGFDDVPNGKAGSIFLESFGIFQNGVHIKDAI